MKRLGLTWDPGAASGLAGTDTLREYDEGNPPHAAEKTWTESHARFSGISGEPTSGIGHLSQTAQVGRMKIVWQGSIIGGAGSYCPFLVPNPPMIKQRCITMHGVFENGDGLVIFFPNQGDNETLHIARLLFTDSNHYLLPTDNPDEQIQEEPFLASTCSDAFKAILPSIELLARNHFAFSASEISSGSQDTAQVGPELTATGARQQISTTVSQHTNKAIKDDLKIH